MDQGGACRAARRAREIQRNAARQAPP